MLRTLILLILIAVAPATANAQAGAAISSYTVQAPGYVSAVIRDGSGQVVRSAFAHKRHEAGSFTYIWDGFDDDGRQAINGTYQLRTVWTPGFVSTYRTMAGTSLGLGQMPGNHRPVESLSIGNSAYLLIASRGDNTSPFETCLTKDGTQRLAEGQRFTGGRVAATAGATTDMPDETDAWYDVTISPWSEAGILRKNQLRMMNRQGIYKCEWSIRLPGQTAADWVGRRYSISALGEVVALGYQDDSIIRFIDCTRQPAGPAGIIPAVVLHSFSGITQPIDLALESTTVVLVTTSSSVLRYNRTTGQLATVVNGLQGASSIDLNRTNGDFYVVVSDGAQVRRYAQNGTLRATYGPTGGRVSGIYDPRAFKGVLDVASDQAGSFWITEEFPRRVALFRDDGTHVRDLFGPQQFYNGAVLDPVDPRRMWMETSAPASADFPDRAGFAFLDGTLDRSTWNLKVNAIRPVPRAVAGESAGGWRAHLINGSRYFTFGRGLSGSLVVKERADGELILTNVLFAASPPWSTLGLTATEKSQRGAKRSFVYTNSREENSYLPADYQWSDTGDGGWDGFFDENLNFYFWDNADDKLYGLARTGWNAAGAPTYADFSRRQLLVHPATAGFPGAIRVHRWMKLSDGGFAALIADESRPHAGSEWPDSLYARWWLAKFTADGRLVWKTGTKNLQSISRETPALTGTLCVPRQFCGEINGCIIVADQVGTPAIAYTLDGVCIGQFLDGHANDGLPGYVYEWLDLQHWNNPRLTDNPLLLGQQTPFNYDMLKGGRVYPGESANDVTWLPQGRNNTPVFSVAGWSGWVTNDAPFTLNRNAVAFVGTGLTAKYFNSANWTGPSRTRIDPDLRLWFMRDRAAYSVGTSYLPGDVVSASDAKYFCVQNTTGAPLTSANQWYKLDPRFVNPTGTGWYRAVDAPGVTSYANFSAIWSGQLLPFHTGTHWFAWEGDAVEIRINGVKVIDLSNHYGQAMSDMWADCGQKFFHRVSAPVELVSGKPVSIEIKMRVSSPVTSWRRGNTLHQEGFSPRAALFWATEGFSARLVESKYFRPVAPADPASAGTATASLASGAISLAWASPGGNAPVQIWRGTDANPDHGAWIATTTADTFVDALPPSRAGVTYWIRSSSGSILAVSNPVQTMGAASSASEILNLSIRGTSDSVHPMIMGFVLGGSSDNELLIRAVGPGLQSFGVSNFVANPQVRLHRMANNQATLFSAVAAWGLEPNANAINAAFTRTGAFPLAANSQDAACLRSLAPGIYTAVVQDSANRQGIGLVELYLADTGNGGGTTRLQNLSARGYADTGGSALIGGFFLNGTVSRRFLLRGIGPTLGNLGVAEPLAHPLLRLFGRDQTQPLLENSGWWLENGGVVQILRAAETVTGAFPLSDGTDDAAVLVELPPGAYTVHLLPSAGTLAGDALIEIYALNP